MSDILEAIILGCGSSGGVPRLGGRGNAGDWGACDPHNPKNRRTRCSMLARRKSSKGETAVLVDTSPDMRQQLLDAQCAALDSVLITHDHADQVNGLDDLRMVAMHIRRRVDVHTDAHAIDGLMARFGYCFVQREGSSYPAICNLHEIHEPFAPFAIEGAGGSLPVLAFGQTHGSIRSLGFRFGPLAYSSDVNGLDDAAFAALEGVDCWIVDTLRYTEHPSHAHLAMALGWIERLKPRRAILTNLHVDLDYEKLKRELPPGVEPAYDGMRIELPL
ncbi:MAG TPA: MBL fold metallo-hydrolase [Rhizomicrobium sp.]|nr:MBL fold metallo-hydrolase [Rhizomicrobium sp.]